MSEWLTIAALRGSLLLAAAAVIWRFLPMTRPDLRRRVALAVLCGALGAPWLPQVWQVTAPVAASEERLPGADFSWWVALGCVWVGGAGMMVARDARAAWRLAGILRRARTGPCCQRGGFDGEIRFSREIDSPCIAGFFRPVLLVPPTAREWSASTWRCVLAHEGQHLRQRDAWALWLGRAVLAAYWWQPLAHWLVRQLELETEIGCDTAVVNAGTPVRDYAEVLLGLAEGTSGNRLSLRMSEPSRLRLRLGRVLTMSAAEGGAAGWKRFAAVMALLGVGGWVSVCGVRRSGPSPAGGAAATDRAASEVEAATRLSANPFPGD